MAYQISGGNQNYQRESINPDNWYFERLGIWARIWVKDYPFELPCQASREDPTVLCNPETNFECAWNIYKNKKQGWQSLDIMASRACGCVFTLEDQ